MAAPVTTTYTTPGTYTFVVPSYANLTATCWGAGGGGASAGGDAGPTAGATGGSSIFSGLTAGGGGGGATNRTGGSGGTASGGTTNTNGEAGGNVPGDGTLQNSGKGGDCPNGGTGGASVIYVGDGNRVPGNPGNSPGGGGSGGKFIAQGAGGGGGAYTTKTYIQGDLTTGSSITITVGERGLGGIAAVTNRGGNGSNGQVTVTYYPSVSKMFNMPMLGM